MPESKPKTAQDVYEIICSLNAGEREELMAMLKQDQNDGWASPEIKQAWVEEVERRELLHRDGKDPNMSWGESRRLRQAQLDRPCK